MHTVTHTKCELLKTTAGPELIKNTEEALWTGVFICYEIENGNNKKEKSIVSG